MCQNSASTRGTGMLAEERHMRIRELLPTQRTVAVSDLTSAFDVTTATIRRDLAALESKGILVRSHGGAISRTTSTDFQLPFETLRKSNTTEKEGDFIKGKMNRSQVGALVERNSGKASSPFCTRLTRKRLGASWPKRVYDRF